MNARVSPSRLSASHITPSPRLSPFTGAVGLTPFALPTAARLSLTPVASLSVNAPAALVHSKNTIPVLDNALLGPAASISFDGDAPSNALSLASKPESVRDDYARFLGNIGFRNYPSIISANLAKRGLTERQRKVLEFNAKRYRVMTAARDLASDVMAGLAEQEYAPQAVETATELAARLLSLQPLDAPASLPADIARKDKDAIREWLIAVTIQKLTGHLGQIVSDVAKAAVPAELLKRGLADLSTGRKDTPDAQNVSARLARIKENAEIILVAAYTDAETGQTRYAGRALAASLVRHARVNGRPQVEELLRNKISDRGQYLENFVGDTLVLPDRDSATGVKRLTVQTGDILGERSAGREAAEITFGVRPARALWWKAFRSRLLGHPLGLWANPKGGLRLEPGQPVRNRLRQLLAGFRSWLAKRRFLNNGYSHVGIASVEEADGVRMAWALDNYPNSGEGGIRKLGIAEDFAQHGPFVKFAVARMNADRVWDSFHAQASRDGYRKDVYRSGGDHWPALITPEEHRDLLAIPRSESSRLSAELSRRAASAIEEMMTRLGTSFAYGFVNEIWSAYCSSTIMLGYRMGGMFEIQEKEDHFHPLIFVMKKLGMPGAKEQNTEGRIIWPGSLFIDPKVAGHKTAEYGAYREAGKITNPYTVPAYVEMDPALTADVISLARLSGRDITPDGDLISASITNQLDSRAQKSRSKRGYAAGAAPATGYSSGLEDLLREGDGE
jgi:hypothetical protein